MVVCPEKSSGWGGNFFEKKDLQGGRFGVRSHPSKRDNPASPNQNQKDKEKMKIKIAATSTGEPKLTQALKAANGKAATHTADAQDVINAAEQIEKQLESLGINKADRAGAQFRFRSGGTVSRSYKYMRKVTDVTAIRGSSAWYLTDAKTTDIWENQSGYCRLTLTEAQDAIAIAKMRSNYNVGEVAA